MRINVVYRRRLYPVYIRRASTAYIPRIDGVYIYLYGLRILRIWRIQRAYIRRTYTPYIIYASIPMHRMCFRHNANRNPLVSYFSRTPFVLVFSDLFEYCRNSSRLTPKHTYTCCRQRGSVGAARRDVRGLKAAARQTGMRFRGATP